MKLHAPFIIGPRLLPALRIGDAFLSLDCVELASGRLASPVFHLDIPDQEEHSIRDLRGPNCHGETFASVPECFESLLVFMSACAESVKFAERTGMQGENADLFPPVVAQWCADNLTEIECARRDLTDENGRVNHSLVE